MKREIWNGNWYWIDRDVLYRYGRSIRASGLAVYNVLASYTNAKTQACFPTHKTIGRIAGMSKRTVSHKMGQLERLGLIRIEKQKGRSICYLLNVRKDTNITSEGDI